MSEFAFPEKTHRPRGPRILLRVAEAERAHEAAKECGLRTEIIAYEGESYTKEAPVGSAQKNEVHVVRKGDVYVEILPGVGIGNFAKFWRILKQQ